MKIATCLRVLPCVFLLMLGSARAESGEESLKNLPAPVQKTIKAEQQQGKIVSIEKKERDGAARYKVVLMLQGNMQRRLMVDGSGKLLRLKNDVAIDALPAPVRKTVDAQGQGGKFVRSTKVTHDGKTEYEVEYSTDGRSKVVLTDDAGKLEKVEEVVTLTTVPAPAKAEIEKSVGKAKLLKIEAITKSGQPTIYEAQYQGPGKKSEIQVGSDGKVLGRE